MSFMAEGAFPGGEIYFTVESPGNATQRRRSGPPALGWARPPRVPYAAHGPAPAMNESRGMLGRNPGLRRAISPWFSTRMRVSAGTPGAGSSTGRGGVFDL